MRVEIENNTLDLGTTPIENMFINTYLSSANEIQIKVYLYALSNAYSGNHDITNENIASEMNLTEGQVVDAWNYWIDQGIVEIGENGAYQIKSVRIQYIQSMNPMLEVEKKPRNTQIEPDFMPLESGNDTREMIKTIEDFISQDKTLPVKLNAREIKVILELKNDFSVDPEFVSYAYMMASTVRGMKGVDPVIATMRNWLIDGATDIEKLELYLASKEKAKKESDNKKQANKSKDEPKGSTQTVMSRAERDRYVEEKLKRKLPERRKEK